MKKIILIALIFIISVGVAVSAPTSTVVQNLYISDLSSSGDPCLTISSAGLISTSTCGAESLWTDAGDFTYLTATDDNLVIGSSTVGSARFHIKGTKTATTTENPLQDTGMETVLLSVFDMNAGYKFTPSLDGTITQLGLRCNSGDRVVRLYDFSTGNVLASTTVTANGTGTWVYADITPITVTSSVAYVVAQRSEGGLNYCRTDFSTPITSGNITIDESRWISSSNAMPTTVNLTRMYGHADVTFEFEIEVGMIVEDGNVGIGVIPKIKLHVGGELMTEGNITVAGNVVPSTDSTKDLGNSTKFWANVYVDKFNLDSDTYLGLSGTKVFYFRGGIRSFGISLTATDPVLYSGGSYIDFNDTVRPFLDSSKDLGSSLKFWDETYTDELVLQQGTMGATAANEVRLAGLDLSAGDSGLHIKTENDTEHLFASKVGIGTTTPAYTLQIIDTASTTLAIGSPTLTGCFIMGDSDGAGISYITVLNGVLSATTTQPSICQ